MTVNNWLASATKQLKAADIPTARLDALVLLQDELNKNSAQLLAEPGAILSIEQLQRLDGYIKRRLRHEPLAYIRQKCEFYGREFVVNQHVLVPRPETETMIELAKNLPPKARKSFVDIGTGSGAIAITLACELGEVQILATDIDSDCLNIAKSNCAKHQATVGLKEADLVEGLNLPAGITVLANLPYVPDQHTINRAAMMEPAKAIFGGTDGLDFYRRLFEQLKSQSHNGYVLTESLPPQHSELTKIALNKGYKLQSSDDFIQVFQN